MSNSHRFSKIMIQTPRDSHLMAISDMTSFTDYTMNAAMRKARKPGEGMADIANLFTDWRVVKKVVDIAIFRERTNAVFDKSRDMWDVFERAASAYEALPTKPRLTATSHKDASRIMGAVVCLLGERFGLLALPAGSIFGNREGVSNSDDIVLRPTDMQRIMYEAAITDMMKNMPAAVGTKDGGALAVTHFQAFLREVCSHIVSKTMSTSFQIEEFWNAVAAARHVLYYGPAFGVPIQPLLPLMEYVNIDIDDSVAPAAPTVEFMRNVAEAMPTILSLLGMNPAVMTMDAASFPAHYRRYQFRVDRTERYAPVVLMRNYPQAAPSGTKLVVQTYIEKFGLHSLTRSGVQKGDILLDQDVSILHDANLMNAVTLLIERREFTGLVSTVNGAELKAIAYCLAKEIEYTAPNGPDSPVTKRYYFDGPRLNQQLENVMDDSPNYENSTEFHSIVVSYCRYDFGLKAFPVLTSVAENLAAATHLSIEVVARKEWKPVQVEASTETPVVGHYVRRMDMPVTPSDPDAAPVVMSGYESVQYEGKLSLNAAMGVSNSYPTIALRPLWTRQLEQSRAQVMLGTLGILIGGDVGMDLLKQSKLSIYAFTSDGQAVSVEDSPDVLMNEWDREEVAGAVATIFFDTFRESMMRVIKSTSVQKAVTYVVRTGKGRDRMPLNLSEATAYTTTRLNVARAIGRLLYGDTAPAQLLDIVAKEPQMIEWLSIRVLAMTKSSL